MNKYQLTHLKELEAESIFIIREVVAQFENPVLLFSGGKDSIVCHHLARKAFYPANVPFPLMHVDTGHNFDELYKFRDQLVEETNARLLVASVQKSIDEGKVVEEKGINSSRNKLQTTTLLDAIEDHQFDCAMGGDCFTRNGVVMAKTNFTETKPEEEIKNMQVRFRTIGDATCTGATISNADSLEKIIEEVTSSRITERGGRADDKRSEAAMEDRKKEGYF